MRGVRVRLHVDAPTLSRLVEVLRTALEADVVAMGLDVGLVEQARELLDDLDDTAHAAGEDALDDLGPPREGGARITVETDDAGRRNRILKAADLVRYLRDGDGVTRLRVVMDVAPVVEPGAYFAAATPTARDPLARVMIADLGTVDLLSPAVPTEDWRELVEGAWLEADRVPERFLDGMHTVLSDHWQGPIVFVWRPEGGFPAQHLTRTYPTGDDGEECDER